jgi:hypothetical protein
MVQQDSHAADVQISSFGAEDAYYSRPRGRTKPWVASVLERFLSPKATVETNRARRNWNQPLREALRTETGLRFGGGQPGAPVDQVTVEVVDGISEPLADIARDHPDPIAWWILLNRRKLEGAAASLIDLHRRLPEIIGSPLHARLFEGDVDAVARSRGLIVRLLAGDIEKPIIERIRRVERDWLGAYFFRQKRIELYAPAIALWSEYLGVPVEDMAIVVLAHELAHAYTHIGQDIDGRVWETDDFAKADVFLVEGLAQFYTDRVCDRLAGRRPAVRTAFDELNKNQSPPYCEHRKWNEIGGPVGEAVRNALIDCRVSRIKDHQTFFSVLQTAHSRLATRRPPPVDASAAEQLDFGS